MQKEDVMRISLINHGCAENLVDAELILGVSTDTEDITGNIKEIEMRQ